MSKNPISISPDKSLSDAARLLHERQIHRLLVQDSAGKLLGIITRGDVVRAMAAAEE